MATERIETEIDTSGPGGNEVIINDDSSPKADELEVVVKDDRPPQDRNRRPYTGKSAEPTDEELETYSRDVQKRMRTMKREFHDVRRERDDFQREHGRAVDFAKRLHQENEQIRRLLAQGHKSMIDTAKASAESEMKTLQDGLKVALEQGDTAQAAVINGKLAQAAARAEAQNHIQPIQFQERPWVDPPQQNQQNQQVQITRKTREWMAENQWFQDEDHKRMTSYALGVHDELIADKVDPDSDEYFNELNKAMREAFPRYEGWADNQDRFDRSNGTSRSGQNVQTRRASPVSGATRTSASQGGKTRVELTASEERLAKRMGLTNQQYAVEKLRLERNDG